MSPLSQARTIGGVGSVFVLLGFVLSGGAELFVAGFILIFIAVRNLEALVKIWDLDGSMQAAVFFLIVGTIIGYLALYRSFPSFVGPSFTSALITDDLLGAFSRFTGDLLPGLIATWFFLMLGAAFLKKSYDIIADGLTAGLFRTTGILFLIGAAMIIVFGTGLIILFVAATVQIAAFLSVPESPKDLGAH